MNNKISQEKIIEKEFKKWQKQYYDDVYSVYEQGDEENLVSAFNNWERKFLKFLQERFSQLDKIYELRTGYSISLAFYDSNVIIGNNNKIITSNKKKPRRKKS